jgi:uncharacterized LabA/DUF88 family protein
MFKPKSERIEKLAKTYPDRIEELLRVFDKPTNVYIDFANVRGWTPKLGWHVDVKRVKQLLDSFDSVREVKFYHGTLEGKEESENVIAEARRLGYMVKTKPVKMMKIPIDVSSIEINSIDILKSFIRPSLLAKLKIETIKDLNEELKILNQQGTTYIEEPKANFDVEIGRDMLRDYDNDGINSFILWSGDSDFEEPIRQLLKDKKQVFIFATARKVATELNSLRAEGLVILDIQKLKEFICYKKEMAPLK